MPVTIPRCVRELGGGCLTGWHNKSVVLSKTGSLLFEKKNPAYFLQLPKFGGKELHCHFRVQISGGLIRELTFICTFPKTCSDVSLQFIS